MHFAVANRTGKVIPTLDTTVQNEGDTIALPDGRRYLLIWSGSIIGISQHSITRQGKGMPGICLECHKCNHSFILGEVQYTRKTAHKRKRSRHYCLGCAVLVGMIEEV